jgi:hypothetical protein
LQRNNTSININKGSGAECPHPFRVTAVTNWREVFYSCTDVGGKL